MKKIERWAYLLIGLVLISTSFTLFISPNHLVFGGVTGLSVVFKYLFGWDSAVFVFVTNVFLILLSYFLLGKEKTLRSLIGSLLLPIFMKIADILLAPLVIENISLELATIYGAVIDGLGIGLVYKAGFTTGGSDIIIQIVNKYSGISIGTAMIIVDGTILISSAFTFGIINALYSGLALYIISKLTDRVILGISNSKAFYIITEEPEKVKEYVIKDMEHGITEINVKGGFKRETQKMLFCVIPTIDYYKLKEGINRIDKNAFFVAVDSYEVSGGA